MITQQTSEILPEKSMTLKDFEAVFKSYYSSLFQYAFSFTRDEEAAKDVVADVFVTLWAKRSQLQISLSTKSYLFAMVKHQALKQVKRHKKEQEESGHYLFSQPVHQPSPLDKYLSHQSTRFLEELINKLPTLRQEIIELKLFGLKNREIAETLHLTEKKVEYQLGQSIEVLKYQIKKAQKAGSLVLESLAFVNLVLMFS